MSMNDTGNAHEGLDDQQARRFRRGEREAIARVVIEAVITILSDAHSRRPRPLPGIVVARIGRLEILFTARTGCPGGMSGPLEIWAGCRKVFCARWYPLQVACLQDGRWLDELFASLNAIVDPEEMN